MKILSVGWFRSTSSTSLHRNKALQKVAKEIDTVELGTKKSNFWFKMAYHLFQKSIPVSLPDSTHANENILNYVRKKYYDIVWIDKGIVINKKTLQAIKKISANTKIVSFSPDNMVMRHNQSQNYLDSLPYYDINFTTKSYIIDDLKKIGAKNIHFIHKTYGEDFHFPRELSENEIKNFGSDIGFVGMWEKERCDSILYLVKKGLYVTVYGDGKWNDFKDKYPNLIIKPGVFSDNYPKVLQALTICLCFLRKINLDQQTARTMEIPACGGFMLAERTKEHQELFEEGVEAEFFSSDEELFKKCTYYLNHLDERNKIAKNGRLKCEKAGYSNEATIKRMIEIVQTNG
ncbi:glycosyl transferase family 1 [Maribacter spongiicola]|uniref:Glycosyl transferase family 1 n=1 Tax=Maribacter spongiicola TaxID=1206753 RepID=A0A4R7K649_9FLAO|nr:glycosyltransferase [Maribacter spongiicola]TDT46735.1 glycosyl transferase family 1 [Maribacter spongiicola]